MVKPVIDGAATYRLLFFWCPGCDALHACRIREGEAQRPSWEWNGNLDLPTLSPSVLLTGTEASCHSFVVNGQIQYCDDCSHLLKGQTVDLPEVSTWRYAP